MLYVMNYVFVVVCLINMDLIFMLRIDELYVIIKYCLCYIFLGFI